jgi:FMN phosphatase YigB (HAD superfamily)
MSADVVFLIDVDNTLLHNDVVIDNFRRFIAETLGEECVRRYWEILERASDEVGYADYLGAIQRFRVERPLDQGVLRLGLFLLDYPFAESFYPGALEAVRELRRRARVVILTDGDAVFQVNKVHRSGLWSEVSGDVLVYVHKEEMLEDIERRYPARHYVLVEDKLRILAATKDVWRDRVTTIFVKQGRFAQDPAIVAQFPAADLSIDRIGDLPQAISRLGFGA